MKRLLVLLVVMLLPMTMTACSGGGGSSSVAAVSPGGTDTGTTVDTGTASAATALQVVDKVSVVDAKLSGSVAAAPAVMKVGLYRFAPPVDSDYNKDETTVYVHERSVEGFNTINEILCMVAQTKYEELLNAGPYKSLVDATQCSSEKGDASKATESSQNQSSGAAMPDYEEWTVNVTRADNNSPEYINAWIHEKGNEYDPPKIITAKVEITEGKSSTNPYGIFTINFAAYPVTQTGDMGLDAMFKGYLKSERDETGKVMLKFVDEDSGKMQDMSFKQAVTLDRGNDDTGKGTVYEKEMHMEGATPVTHEQTFNIAYSPDFFMRDDGIGSVCLSRTDFEESAWRYGMYDATTGARVNRNSGFSINTKADGSGAHGWVGYWGVWIDNNSALPGTVYKYDYGTKTSSPYEVFNVPGKLKKHVKGNLALGEVKGVPLDYWEQSMDSMGSGTNYRVIWNAATETFDKKAMMVCGQMTNCNWENITTTPTPTINIAHLQWGELNFHSESLGGQVRVPLETAATPCSHPTSTDGPGYTDCSNHPPTSSTQIIFFKEDIVYPTDAVPANLVCYDQCPQVTASSIDMYPNWDPNTGQQTRRNYTFDSAAMLLMDGSNPVVLTATNQQYQWGIMSGPLFEPTQENMDLLKCDWQNPQGGYDTCGWKAWSILNEFYTWETGPDNWNQFTGLKDPATGTFLTFEPPLQVKYVHNQAGSPFNGASFYLNYEGFGNLNGIPGKCVDMDTGGEVDCSEGGPGKPVRWVPAYSIPSGASVYDGTKAYLVKPLEMEQRMKKDATGGCSTLTPQFYELPLITDWVDPAIGSEPTVTAAPAVIGGVVQ